MGIEYQLRFEASDSAAVANVLRRHPAVRDVDPSVGLVDYGATADGGAQATAQVDAGGAYFCDHCCGEGHAILGELVARLAAAFGPVTVEEL